MSPSDPAVNDALRGARIARIATRSARGTPQIMPLWFVQRGRSLWMTNAETSPTVRNIIAGSAAVVIVDADGAGGPRCLRIRGRARYHAERRALARTVFGQVPRYYLAPSAVLAALRHPARIPRMVRYYSERRDSGVIEFIPENAEFLPR